MKKVYKRGSTQRCRPSNSAIKHPNRSDCQSLEFGNELDAIGAPDIRVVHQCAEEVAEVVNDGILIRKVTAPEIDFEVSLIAKKANTTVQLCQLCNIAEGHAVSTWKVNILDIVDSCELAVCIRNVEAGQ